MLFTKITLRRLAGILTFAAISGAALAEEPTATPLPQPAPARPPRALPAGVKALRNIEYVPGGGRSRSLDLFLPENAGPPKPLIVFVHGGGWRSGSKEGEPASGLVPMGFATASINYRLSQQAIFPAQIEDCKAAIRFLRGHAKDYNLDPDHIGVWGSSAGGHLVALLGTSGDVKELEGKDGDLKVSSRVQAVCDWFGPTDFAQIAAQPDGSAPDPNGAIAVVYQLLGGTIAEKPEQVRLANPITFITKDDAPFLIMHGDHDPLVPLAQSKILDAALKAGGVESRLYIVEGGGHGSGFRKPEIVEAIREFFTRHLKP